MCYFLGVRGRRPRRKTLKCVFRAFLSLVGALGRRFWTQLAGVFLLVKFQHHLLRKYRGPKPWKRSVHFHLATRIPRKRRNPSGQGPILKNKSQNHQWLKTSFKLHFHAYMNTLPKPCQNPCKTASPPPRHMMNFVNKLAPISLVFLKVFRGR